MRNTLDTLNAVLPAPGWRVFEAYWSSDEPEGSGCEELPVLGFAFGLKEYPDGEKEVLAQLMVWDDEYGGVSVEAPLLEGSNTVLEIVPPGKGEPSDLIQRARQKVKDAEWRKHCTKEAVEKIARTLVAAHPKALNRYELESFIKPHGPFSYSALKELKAVGWISCSRDFKWKEPISLTDKGFINAKVRIQAKEKADGQANAAEKV